jgi:hypothetical protein
VFSDASAVAPCQDIVQGQAASPLTPLALSADLLTQSGWTINCDDPLVKAIHP